MKHLSARIPEDLHEKVLEESERKGSSKAEIIRERLQKGYSEDNQELIEEKNKRIKEFQEQIEEVKENRRAVVQDKNKRIELLEEKIEGRDDQIKELSNELREEREETATFGEWVTGINPLGRFFIKAGLMVSGWNIPERVKEEQE